MRSKTCVDASLIAALLVPERFSQASLGLLEEWVRDDAHYLALAKHQGCTVWTGDQRLYNAVKDGFEKINWIGDHPKAVTR